jgi:hypothetical protein
MNRDMIVVAVEFKRPFAVGTSVSRRHDQPASSPVETVGKAKWLITRADAFPAGISIPSP